MKGITQSKTQEEIEMFEEISKYEYPTQGPTDLNYLTGSSTDLNSLTDDSTDLEIMTDGSTDLNSTEDQDVMTRISEDQIILKIPYYEITTKDSIIISIVILLWIYSIVLIYRAWKKILNYPDDFTRTPKGMDLWRWVFDVLKINKENRLREKNGVDVEIGLQEMKAKKGRVGLRDQGATIQSKRSFRSFQSSHNRDFRFGGSLDNPRHQSLIGSNRSLQLESRYRKELRGNRIISKKDNQFNPSLEYVQPVSLEHVQPTTPVHKTSSEWYNKSFESIESHKVYIFKTEDSIGSESRYTRDQRLGSSGVDDIQILEDGVEVYEKDEDEDNELLSRRSLKMYSMSKQTYV